MSTVEAFQRLRALGFVGEAKRIQDIDLPRIGHMLGVGEDEIHAVIDVEASGSGFDRKGRPKILFEPHVFYRNLSGQKRALAVAKGLAYPEWKRGNYPADSYPRFLAALDIDEEAAIKACSWGLSQILGENFVAAGYSTPQEMVVDFALDEDNHLEAMARFIKANFLDDELRRHDWRGFARGYNGERYAENDYHNKLATAYEWWAKKPDTPWSPDRPADPVPGPTKPVPADPGAPTLPERKGHLWSAYVALALYFGDEPPKEKPMNAIIGAVVGRLVVEGAREALRRMSDDPTRPLTPHEAVRPSEIPVIANEVASEVNDKVLSDPRIREYEQIILHRTNNEPFTQSRVATGAAGAGVAGVVVTVIGLAQVFGYDLSGYYDELVMIGGGLVSVGGAVWALIGRYKARKPIGA